ncbi:hypothetical protein DFQ14_11344 [Halopolyspora algeriensis]|uniref:Uncharacterized protein n=2 Tax=Halopolyspora algeriensis TaxID=1500506 RepID=A0A368VFM1_9ACTN|nr:hypothetical protein [Halopolyspora algeriensis]RCW39962.1 hypothetical protein DFQ14_11344 [Halopolyspora algeriensis]TQM46601.1 hypothetical protein FHU43_3718 [Halopolyspora algeriensis]
MFPNPFLGDRIDVYWIVGLSTDIRHATDILPGARPSGDWVPTLCERWIRLPFPTVAGRRPATEEILDQCPQCLEIAEARECFGVLWDF